MITGQNDFVVIRSKDSVQRMIKILVHSNQYIINFVKIYLKKLEQNSEKTKKATQNRLKKLSLGCCII